MSQRLPDKVRAGDQLSAKWLNSLVDYLKYLNDMQQRRRLLKGVGYAVSESPGGSSLTIDRQAVVRVLSDDLDILRNEEFQVRIKPKGLCTVNKETGDWDKVVQVHVGRITNHRDFTLPVIAREQDENDTPSTSTSPSSTGSSWDAASWVDIDTLDDLGQKNDSGRSSSASASSEDDGSKKEIAVYVKMTIEGDLPVSAVFCSDIKPDEASGAIYVPIGTVRGESVEGSPRYYITQFQQGPIELGGAGGTPMPFDVTLSVKIVEPEEGSEEGEEEPEPQTCINVAGGRVFMPERQYTIIPDKQDWAIDVFEGYPMYVTLTLSRDGEGNVSYKYELQGLSAFGTEVEATEEQEETP